MFDCLVSLLEDASFDNFNETLWAFKPDFTLTLPSKAFLDIVKYTLCSFHLSCRSLQEFAQNHERTHFVENIIPSLLALAKVTGLVEFKWCESPSLSSRVLNQQEYDYDYRSAPPNKSIDALGIFKTWNNMETIFVEASSGILKEHTTHTIEDSLKILECSMSALRKEASHYKNASKKTFEELKVFSVHVVTTQVTLCEMSFHDENNWKVLETRTAKLPTNWNDRICLVQYLELLATLFKGVLKVQEVQKKLVKENIGLVQFDGPSIRSICETFSTSSC
ncbi:hypothetical protein BDF14DRAFT_1724649 [Spinellus fusiger]|nr:hypothetical protein BDF14DRAFT_1724649 [Spinellus fusiger]